MAVSEHNLVLRDAVTTALKQIAAHRITAQLSKNTSARTLAAEPLSPRQTGALARLYVLRSIGDINAP